MTIRSYDSAMAADWLRLLNLARVVPLAAEAFVRREAMAPSDALRRRHVAVERGGILAIGELASAPYAPPHHLACLVVTDPAHRRAGLGTAMLALLEAEADALGRSALTATVPETGTEAFRWAERRGFMRHATRFDSVLDLSAMSEAAGAPAVPEGVTLRNMEDAGPEAWSALFAIFPRLLADAPDMAGLPPWDEARCRSVLRESPAARPRWIIVAWNRDRPVGLTIGQSMGDGVYSFFTGVAADWRGLGLGKALKLSLIEAARRDGARVMRTTNLDCNLPALRLNASLGFRRVPGSIEIRKLLSPAHNG